MEKTELMRIFDDLIVKYAAVENFQKAEMCFSQRKSMRREEARGGCCISRGYYSRAILEEIVVTNVRRGRILTGKARKKPDYEFYFDEKDALVLAVRNHEDIDGYDFEWIFWEGNREISVTLGDVWRKQGAFSITVTEWEDGKQRKYIHAHYSFFRESDYYDMPALLDHVRKKAALHQLDYDRSGFAILEMEEYEYEGDRMTRGRWSQFEHDYLTWNDITFCYDENGRLLHCLMDSDSISFRKETFDIDWEFLDCPWMHEEEDPRVPIPEHIKAIITGRTVSAPAKKGFRLKPALTKAIKGAVDAWEDDDIYAVSFFVGHDGDEVTELMVSCNTERDCDGAELISEKRWNHAFWSQDEEDLTEILEQCPNRPSWETVLELLSEIAAKFQKEHYLKKKLGRTMPILIHGYEYEPEELAATERGNPGGEAADFFQAIKQYFEF